MRLKEFIHAFQHIKLISGGWCINITDINIVKYRYNNIKSLKNKFQ